ncbi:MAG: hypothetical protein ACK5HY_03885 [Parahaliea sp.]
MGALYNIYFAGEVLPGQNPDAVRDNLQRLFKADADTLARLFSGKAQLVKRQCDKPTALKYKQAMERAGARPLIKRLGDDQRATTAAASITSAAATAPTMAERIAAIAAEAERKAAPPPPPPIVRDTSEGLSLEPVGSEVLRPEERASSRVEPRVVDTSALSLAAIGERLGTAAPPPPAAPDTRNLSMAAAGEQITNLPGSPPVPEPDISGITLSPEGTDFSDCAPPPASEPELDLSALAMAAAGTDLLDASYRRNETVAAPDTSHLSVSKAGQEESPAPG